MGKRIEMKDKEFGSLTVVEFCEVRKNHAFWICKCVCGKETIVDGSELRKGKAKSCGCRGGKIKKKRIRDRFYQIWCNMKSRCLNPNNPRYADYGGRGITICEKWQEFKGFKEDMIVEYSRELTLDRINNNGNYCKENCRWATDEEQKNNTRHNVYYNYNGEIKTLAYFCNKYNLNYVTIYLRIKRGMNVKDAIEKPIKQLKKEA